MKKSTLTTLLCTTLLACSSPTTNLSNISRLPSATPISPHTQILHPDNILTLPSTKKQRQHLLQQYETNQLPATQTSYQLQHLLHQEEQTIASLYLEKLYGVKIPLLYERTTQPDLKSDYISYCLAQKKALHASSPLTTYLRSYQNKLDNERWEITTCYPDLPQTNLGSVEDFYQSLKQTLENIIQDISWPNCTSNPKSFHYDLTNNAYSSYQERTLQEQAQFLK